MEGRDKGGSWRKGERSCKGKEGSWKGSGWSWKGVGR